MATFPGYYVGSNLSDLGRNMSMDRDSQNRLEAQRMEQQRLQYAAFMQAMAQREQQAQQAQQFQQELALRGQGQSQQNAYQQALLGLQKQQQDFAQTGIPPTQKWNQEFAEKELLNRLEIAKLGQGQLGQQGIAALINQQGLTARDTAQAQEVYDATEAAAKAKASQYNALLDQIEQEAKDVEKKHDPWGWTTAEDKKMAGEQYKRSKFSELLQAMQIDKRPGDISQNPVTKRFEPALPPRSGAKQIQGMPSRQSALLQALQGTESLSNTNTTSPVVQSAGPTPEYQAAVEALRQQYRAGKLDVPGYNRARAALDAQFGIR